jgi:hypothetical protein
MATKRPAMPKARSPTRPVLAATAPHPHVLRPITERLLRFVDSSAGLSGVWLLAHEYTASLPCTN